MSWLDWFRGPAPDPPAQERAAGAPSSPLRTRALAGGRLSYDNANTPLFGSFATILPPPDYDQEWRTLGLDGETLSRIRPAELMQMLADLSPDVSRAIWDFLRAANPGWECTAYRPGSDTVDEAATGKLKDFLSVLDDLYGSVDIVFGRLFFAAFLRGAFLLELILDELGRMPVDLATPDPASVRFRSIPDPVRGTVWQIGQWQRGGFVPFDRPTIRYVPVDPFPGSPYGRPMVAPALFSTLFLLGLFHDLRRVIAQQGYPRIDVELVMEELLKVMPDGLTPGSTEMQEWINAAITEVQNVYAGLKPEDAYVHLGIIKINRPVGTVDSSSLGAIEPMVQALERMAIKALKTAPFMMAGNQSTTETQANRQYEAYIQGVKSIQHYAEAPLERLLGLALQAQGIQATVKFRFAENRASEMLRDEQTRSLKITNTSAEYIAGWISQDEAAEKVVGHAPDQPKPRAMPGGQAPANPNTTEPEPGVTRAVQSLRGPAEKVKPRGKALPTVPDVIIRDRDIAAALDGWDEEMPDEARGMLDAEVVD